MYSAILWCIQTHSALHHPQHVLVFTVVGSGLLALRTSRRTPAWLGISCWSFNVKKAVGDLTHHGGLLDCPLVPASSGRCRSSVECANYGGASSSVQFSSVQFEVVSMRSEKAIIMRSTPSLRSFPNIAFETVLLFVIPPHFNTA